MKPFEYETDPDSWFITSAPWQYGYWWDLGHQDGVTVYQITDGEKVLATGATPEECLRKLKIPPFDESETR